MYDAIADPYCYPGTTVLRNIPDLRDQPALDAFEAISTAQRAGEPLPAGRFSVSHYKAFHHHLFQDIYVWAGRYRTVRLAKDGSMFCYPEHIAHEMKTLFGELKAQLFLRDLALRAFAERGAHFLATLNAIHPFREGNGRTQTTFFAAIAHQAGHPLDLEKLDPAGFLNAMIVSFTGDEAPLAEQIHRLSAQQP